MFLILVAGSILFCACANEPVVVAPGAVAPGAVAPGAAAAAQQPVQQEQQEEDGGIGKRVTDLFGKARANAPSFDDMKKMLSDAGDATGQTTDDTMKWVNETYKSLSDRGLTTAKNASEWVAEDWNSINAWEYKVVSLTQAESKIPALLEKTLNEAGNQRWDCFHVSESAAGTKFFMKRQKKSYLKNIPLRDMLKLIPLLDNEE